MISFRKKGDIKLKSLTNSEKHKLHRKVGIIAVNHFKEGFTKGGGQTDNSKGGWAPRKREDRKRPGRPILVDSGKLKRSIKQISASSNHVTIGSRVHYASYHNQGTNKMARREILGDSRELNRKIKMELQPLIKEIIKKTRR